MNIEILPGIHRIESDRGERFMCQYLLAGRDRKILIDTGLARTPEEVIAPYLQSIGLSIVDVDVVLISHADVDHCGGNQALKEMASSLRFLCGEADRAWVETTDLALADLYRWSDSYGFGPGWRIEIMHLPGHTPGHLGIWDERDGTAIIIDAALERGIYDREGVLLLQPPRYFGAVAYRATIRQLRALNPEHLLTAHFPPIQGSEVADFLDRSLEFTDLVEEVIAEGLGRGDTDLWELTQLADERLGPYPDFAIEIGAGVRAHLAAL
jgi:glyoxylase-like metal-dependent hydrolase (beta-lactamase superfamily II)